MGYRFKPDNTPEEEILRVFAERIQHARKCLAAYPDPNPEGLHEARKDIKKLRSLLRLLRHPDLREERQRLNAELAEAGRRLSAPRDHEVVAGMMQDLLRTVPTEENPVLCRAARKLYKHLAAPGGEKADLSSELVTSVSQALDDTLASLRELPLDKLSWKRVRKTARRCGKRMHKARFRFLETHGIEHFHDWRKRLKDHLYHLDLLRSFEPKTGKQRKQADKLEDLLGKARDCDLLTTILETGHGDKLTPAEQAALRLYAEREKQQILRAVEELTQKDDQRPGRTKASRPRTSDK